MLIEKPVYSEYQTFRKNRANDKINYAYVDSVNIFYFIEEILAQPRNNPVHTFEQHSEIESWLKEQWAGLFRELIQRTSSQRQLASLSSEVQELKEVNKTLKRYLEALLVSETPEKSEALISAEDKRLEEARKLARLQQTMVYDYFHELLEIDDEPIWKAFCESQTGEEFVQKLSNYSGKGKVIATAAPDKASMEILNDWYNQAKVLVESSSESTNKKSSKRARINRKRGSTKKSSHAT